MLFKHHHSVFQLSPHGEATHCLKPNLLIHIKNKFYEFVNHVSCLFKRLNLLKVLCG